MARRRLRKKRKTRLFKFLLSKKLKPNEVADVTGISRQHLLRLRSGISEPTRPVMIWLTVACRRILESRRNARVRVRVQDLFDLGDDR